MKKGLKILLIVIGVLAAVIIAAVLCVNLFLFRTISEKKTDAFLSDSRGAVCALLTSGGDVSDSEFMACLAVSSLEARTGGSLLGSEDAYAVSEEDLQAALSALFYDAGSIDLSGLPQEDGSGKFLLPRAAETGDLTYTVTDSFYGYIGSEPTTLTVHYTCGGQACDVTYSLVYEKASPYTFVITDLTVSG